MKWKLTERAYINERVLEAETELGDGTPHTYHGTPGPHLEPLDDEARRASAAWHERNPHASLDVMGKLPLTERMVPTDPIERLALLLAPLVAGAPERRAAK